MANLTKCDIDTNVISKLGTRPDERGLNADEFKAKFDEGTTNEKNWINDVHLPELDAKFTAKDNEIASLSNTIITAYNSSMARQAIIDGNFQIAQANPVVGTVIANPATNAYPVFDLWKTVIYADNGTYPTVNHSQQVISPVGSVPNSYFCYRINVNSAGTNLGLGSIYAVFTHVENGLLSITCV
jgi:hypothetical protein